MVNNEFLELQKEVTKEGLTCDEIINDIQNRAQSNNIVFIFEKLPVFDFMQPSAFSAACYGICRD